MTRTLVQKKYILKPSLAWAQIQDMTPYQDGHPTWLCKYLILDLTYTEGNGE